MALTLSSTGFFEKALSKSPASLEAVISLLGSGVTFTIGMYSIVASYKGKDYPLNNLPSSTTSLATDPVGADKAVARKQIQMFLGNMVAQVVSNPAVTKTVAEAKAASWPGLEEMAAAQAPAGDTVTVSNANPLPPKAKKAPVANPGVIPLTQAEVLGQKVSGTTKTYKLIAYHPRIRVAARTEGNDVSIRIECVNATQDDMNKIKASGMPWKGVYGSMHIPCGELPIPQVLGSYLFKLGVRFERMIQAGEPLVC